MSPLTLGARGLLTDQEASVMHPYIQFYHDLIAHTFEWLPDAFVGAYVPLTILVVGLLSICAIISVIALFLRRLSR